MHKKYFYIALPIFIITAIFSMGHNHPDEYHQILGFAAYKLGLMPASKLQWEYTAQMRPALQVFFATALVKLSNIINLTNPFTIATLLRIITAFISFISISLFIKIFINEIKNNNLHKFFILTSLFGYLVVYNSVRFSSETWGGDFLVIAISLLCMKKYNNNPLYYILIGFILGISFISRFQMGFAIFGLGIWLLLVRKLQFKFLLSIILGFTITLGFGILLDYWLYGNFVFTPWNYFLENIINNKASSFGEESILFYLAIMAFIPLGPLYVIAPIFYIILKPKHIITWAITPFILAHLIVGHKELRFLVPIIVFMPFCTVFMLEYLSQKYTKLNTIINKPPKWIKFSWNINTLILIGVMIMPSATQLPLGKRVYELYTKPTTFYYITEGGNILDFYKRSNLKLVQIQSPNQALCEKNQSCLVALTCQQIRDLNYSNGKIIYNNCPKWIFKIDFNNWLERSALYNVYDISK